MRGDLLFYIQWMMYNSQICFGRYIFWLALSLVLPCTVSASSTYVYTNRDDLHDWVSSGNAGLDYTPIVYWVPESVSPAVPYQTTASQGTDGTYRYGMPSLIIFVFDAYPASDSIEVPDLSEGRYSFFFEIDSPGDWDYLNNASVNAWGDIYGRFNALILDSTIFNWVGDYPPVFRTNWIYSQRVVDLDGYGVRFRYPSGSNDPCWDGLRRVVSISLSFPRWTCSPVIRCFRTNFQGGDDWVWATVSCVDSYFEMYEPDVALPGYFVNLPYKLYDVAFWWPSNNITLRYGQKVLMTNDFGVYTNDTFRGPLW